MIPLAVNNLSISLVQFKIENYKLAECDGWSDFNITWADPSIKPVCITSEWESLRTKKRFLFNSYDIECNDPDPNHRQWGLIDYLFLRNPHIEMANTIEFFMQEDQQNLKNFRQMIEIGRYIRCQVYGTSCTQENDENISSSEIFEQIILNYLRTDKYFITPLTNNVELFDAGTKKMSVNVYFYTQQLIGIYSFSYEMAEASASTSVFARSSPIDSPASVERDGLYYLEYIQILCVGLLSFQLYMKYLKIRSIKETLNNSFFFVMFVIFFIFEYIFKIINYFKGTTDYVFVQQLIPYPDKRELIPYYLENIKILKSFSIVFLSYHMIYVVFDIKYLVVFTSFLKPVFQRFLIVLSLIILSLSLMIMVISGRFYNEFSSFSLAFFNLLNYVLGVDSPTITDDSTFPVITTQTRFYFKVASYALRLMVLNFTLIIMFHIYRKNDIKKIRAQKK